MPFEIHGKLFFDASDLDRIPEKARQLEHTLAGAFRRTGDIRAGAALEGFITNLTSGNVAGAIESVASRMTGLGLIGGVVFGTLATGFAKGQEEFKKLNDSLGKLDTARLQTGMEGFRATFSAIAPVADVVAHPMEHMLAVIMASKSAIDNWKDSIKDANNVMTLQLREQGRELMDNADVQQKILEGRKSEAAVMQAMTQYQKAVTTAKIDEKEASVIIDKLAPPGAPQREALTRANQEMFERAKAAAQQTFDIQEKAVRVGQMKDIWKKLGVPENIGPSMEDLLAAGQLAPNANFQIRHRQAFPVALQGDALLAGIAQRQTLEAERLAKLGLTDQAKIYMGMAAQTAAGIKSFQPEKEMTPENIGQSVGSQQIFKDMLDKLTDIASGSENVGGAISFQNK